MEGLRCEVVWIALCLQFGFCGGSEGLGPTKGSFLWQIEGAKGVPSYFFGTIHVPYTRVWDAIPNNTKAAFDAASQVNLILKFELYT